MANITIEPFGSSAQPDASWWANDPIAPKAQPVANEQWWANDPVAPKNGDWKGTAQDVGLSIPSGIARGIFGLVGLPGAAKQGVDWLGDLVESKISGTPQEQVKAKREALVNSVNQGMPFNLAAPATPQDVQAGIEKVTGPLHQSTTMPGKIAGGISEFIPAALAGPGSVGRNFVNFALAPGIASEAVGHATGDNPWAKAGAAVLTGGVAALLNRPGVPSNVIRQHLTNVPPAAIDRAEVLINEAAQRGVTLTWAEAIEQVAPGSGLTNVQRTLEATPQSREILNPIMAQRPAQVQNAARQEFGNVAPQNPAPSTIGPAVSQAANQTVGDVRGAINAHTQPLYTAAERVTLSPAEMARVQALPGYQDAVAAVRGNPQLARYVNGLPENSVGFLNEVKKYFDQQARNAPRPTAPNPNQQVAAGWTSDATNIRGTLTNASPEYAAALQQQATLRQQYLEPLLQGPLGQLAKRDVTTKRAIDALFPTNPLPNSAAEIGDAVRALAARNPAAARDLVRAHLESTFNEAAQNLQGGANQFGGAKFAATIVGNPQQRANLEAAVRALPNGDATWNGFGRFLEVVEATGKRQNIGSKTAYNTQELRDLSTGSMAANAAKLAGSPNKLLSAVSDAWSRWQLGGNVDQLARIITDPNSAGMLRALAGRQPGTHEAMVIAGRILTLAGGARQERR